MFAVKDRIRRPDKSVTFRDRALHLITVTARL
jgi:hypothetical protein